MLEVVELLRTFLSQGGVFGCLQNVDRLLWDRLVGRQARDLNHIGEPFGDGEFEGGLRSPFEEAPSCCRSDKRREGAVAIFHNS